MLLSLPLAVVIALPIATPKELKNSASYSIGNFTNRTFFLFRLNYRLPSSLIFGFCQVYDWPSGFAFILSFMAPLWTISTYQVGQ